MGASIAVDFTISDDECALCDGTGPYDGEMELSDGDRRYGEACRCCGGRYATTFAVAAWRSEDWTPYQYGECGTCSSLNLIDAVDPSSFYAEGYWDTGRPSGAASTARRVLGRVAAATVMTRTPLAHMAPRPLRRPEWLSWLAGSGLNLNSPILDIGCGQGRLLAELSRWGFDDLTGVDPFLDADRVEKSGVRLQARSLAEVSRTDYSVAIFHHSLEHVDNPVEMLQLARARLSGAGARIVVALPVAQGPVWERYRDNWWAVDAPLHRFVPTIEGLRRLASGAGLEVGRIVPSSPAHHLIGSELIVRRARPGDPPESVLTKQEIKVLAADASSLNTPAKSPQLSIVMKLT